jgi:hypothetical protein
MMEIIFFDSFYTRPSVSVPSSFCGLEYLSFIRCSGLLISCLSGNRW